MATSITIDKRAVGQLKKLPKATGRKIFKVIQQLKDNPTPQASTKLETTGHLRKIRVGQYRVVYALEADEVFVMKIAHRKDVYQRLDALEKRLLRLHLKR
jgi:mRNA interferase RelE/StbE